MKGKIIKDWSKINFGRKEDCAKVLGALQFFMKAPDHTPAIKAAFQQFATKGDFPAEVLQILEKYNVTTDYDLGYENIFDIKDFTGTNQSGFEILDVENGLTFALVKPGQKAKVFGMSGSKATVSFDMYGGALGWTRTLIDDRQYWALEDAAVAFRNIAYASRAKNFYALLEAVASTQDIAWAAVTPSGVANTNENYEAIRDANTINKACETILKNCKDKGYGITDRVTFVLTAPIELKGRIDRALLLVQQAFAGSGKRVSYNVQVQYSLLLTSSTDYYITLPKKKMKGGYRMDLTIFSDFDMLAYADSMAGWMRYGGAIGDVNQIARCKTS